MSNNKTALVTGASGGIGSEIAIALSKQGYRLILQGRNREKLALVKEKLVNESFIVTGDLTNNEDRDNIIEQAFNFDQIDILINCVGVSHFASFEQTTPNEITRLLSINTLAPMLFIKAFITFYLRISPSPHCTIINVGSVFGSIGYPGFTSYCASKFALRGFTEALAREYSNSNLRIAYFSPRATKTEINTNDVDNLNVCLGNTIDEPTFVASEFMKLLASNKSRKTVGWPEKLFARLNGLLPELVDHSISSQLVKIKSFFPTTDK